MTETRTPYHAANPTPSRTGILRGRIATAIKTFLATHPDTSDAEIIAALSAILDAYRRSTVHQGQTRGGLSAEELEEELDMRPAKEIAIQQASTIIKQIPDNILFIRTSSNDALLKIQEEAEKYGDFYKSKGRNPHYLVISLEWDTSEVKKRLEQL